MAEVFLALQEGIGGFEKLVVVKRIFKHFCEDESFVQMFLDEARLAAHIRHPNVVEILDIKKDAEGFFIVMEYLSGENLAYVFEELVDRGTLMPAHLVCRVGAEIAGGLHSAHISTDVDGKLHPIVHRDVTPSNLIVCFNGVVKIVDFGVAKAQVENRQTRPGTLKGKIEYLAPEQVENRAVSPATDVFQLGVVLHELFTGERLFSGDSDHAIMNAVLERPIPRPSDLRPDLPRQVDEVILGALERDVAKRTQTADALRRGLEGVMRHLGTGATQRSLGDWMMTAFEKRFHERRDVERECVQQVREGRASSEIPAVLAPFAPTAPVVYEAQRATAATVAERPSGRLSTGRRPRRRPRFGLVAGALLVAGVGLFIYLRSGTGEGTGRAEAPLADAGVSARPVLPATAAVTAAGADAAPAAEQPSTYQATIRTIPPEAVIYFDGEEVGRGSFSIALARDGSSHRIVVKADGYESHSIFFRDAPPPDEVVLTPLATAADGRKSPGPARRPPSGADSPGETVVKSGPDEPSGSQSESGAPSGERRLPPTDNRNPWKRKR